MSIDYSLYSRGLTYVDLGRRWNVSTRHARRLVRQLGIPMVRLGHRTIRFRLQDVELREARLLDDQSRGGGV